jgi:hypothetical protein
MASLLDKLTTQGSDLTYWDGTTPPPLKNTSKTQTQMHWAGPTAPTDGYSLDGSPNLQTQKADYFRMDSPKKSAVVVLPPPSQLDFSNGELTADRYKLGAPEGRGFLVNGL